jgi:hypothetical protein
MSVANLLGIHLVCHGGKLVVDLPDGRFETRRWVLDRRNLAAEEVYVALHEHREDPSYRQGVLVGWDDDEEEPGRVVLAVRETDTPLHWVGGGTGEKGLAWALEPGARRNRSLVFGPTPYLARICWNSKGWRCATGEARGLETPPSFVTGHHFGHEEWLFNNLWEIESWRYGFLQPVNHAWEHHQGEVIDVGLYTIAPNGRRLWAGRLRRAEVLTKSQARAALEATVKRGLLKKMREEVEAIGEIRPP